MGLTESNHSKATTGCTGPSKSRSTPHFPDSRGYQNRPRQAATLPARRTPESSQTPPYHHPRTPMHDPQPLGHDPRPPEVDPLYKDCFVQVGRSPNVRPLATRRSASADSRKRRSDPLLDTKAIKQLPEVVSYRQPAAQVPDSSSRSSPPMSPRGSYQRPRPTAIYVADDHPAPLGRSREGRSRDRTSLRGKSRNVHKTEKRDRSRGSGERGQCSTHVSTYTMTPHFPEKSLSLADNEIHPQSHHRHRRTRHRSRERPEVTEDGKLQSDPYVGLHYGGTVKDGQRKPIQQVTAWRTEHREEEEPSSPNCQMSRVVIQMNQVTATTFDNYDALNANIESIQVRRNVWFQSSQARSNVSESPVMRKISSKAMRTPSISESTSGYSSSEMIQWPDVTNKVSSIYMVPDMQIGNGLPQREKPDIAYYREESSSSHEGCNCEQYRIYGQGHSSSHPPKDRLQSVSYPLPESIETENWCLKVNKDEGKENLSNVECTKDCDETVTSLYESDEARKNNPSFMIASHIEIQPPLEFSEETCVKNFVSDDTYQPDLDNVKGRGNVCGNKDKMKLHFGINNHVEDYTIIEDASNDGQFYGCWDSDLENGDSQSIATCEALLSDTEHYAFQASLDKPLECGHTQDNESVSDNADKVVSENMSELKDNSVLVLKDTDLLLENSSLERNAKDDLCNMTCQVSNESDFDDFHKRQLLLVSEYLSLKDSCASKTGEKSSETFRKLLDPCECSYPVSTLPGSPSASSFTQNQKCLSQYSSLPRDIQCVNRSADTDNMKSFRNRFRSFDLGHFPVLRLPLGNQPRLVDVLRATAANLQANNSSFDETLSVNSPHLDHAMEYISDSSASSPTIADPIVSYSSALSSQREQEAVDSGSSTRQSVYDNGGVPSENRNSSDSSRTGSCHETQFLRSNEGIHEDDDCLSDEGCDVGTIMRGTVPGLTSVNNSIEYPNVSLSCDINTTLPIHDRRSASIDHESSTCRRDQGQLIEGSSGTENSWQSDEVQHVESQRWSKEVDYNGLSSESDTLRPHPKASAFFHQSNKCRANSDCSLQRRLAASHKEGKESITLPVFHKNIRRKQHNRKSLHSIDWDTPLPPVPVNAKSNCSYTCHEQCQDLVTLDCKADLTPDSHTSEEDLYEDTSQGTLVRHDSLSNQNLSITVTSQDDETLDDDEDCHEEQEEKHEEEQQEKELLEEPFRKHEEVSTLRKSVNRLQSHLVDNETLEAWVEKYNATTQGLQIAKENDGSYRGCIRVHLNLSRPINIVAGTRPPSIYDILQEDRTMEKTLTSFYMPRDAVKAIHITSKTTTREVIIALLRKFKVVDNPQKFALYERTYDTGQPGKAKLRRLGDSECPLVLAINWSAQGLTNKRLVLQENDTADIQWEAFSLPELSNFLRILDREEEEYRCQIKDKYALLRRRIGNMLIQNSPSNE